MHPTYYIIVVEKDETLFGKIVRALEKLGFNHNVRRVSTEAELDDELFRLAPDFVICDHSRTEWNSFAVLQQVRAFQSSMPFALIGGALDEGTHATLLASGVDACLDFDHLGDLAPALHGMLKRHAEQDWQCVEEIRRSLPPMPLPRRRGGSNVLQFRVG